MKTNLSLLTFKKNLEEASEGKLNLLHMNTEMSNHRILEQIKEEKKKNK